MKVIIMRANIQLLYLLACFHFILDPLVSAHITGFLLSFKTDTPSSFISNLLDLPFVLVFCACILKLHTLELSLKQINKILGQIDGYLFFWPFCSEKKIM